MPSTSRTLSRLPDVQAEIDNPLLYPGPSSPSSLDSPRPAAGFTAGQITVFKNIYFNFGDIHVAGFDADVSYAIQTAAGQFTPSLAVSNIYKWQSSLTPNSPTIDSVSKENIGVGFAPRWKGTAALAWRAGLLSVTASGRYISRYKDYQEFVPNNSELGDSWVFDFNTRWEAGQAVAGGKYVAVRHVCIAWSGQRFQQAAAIFLWTLSLRL